MALGFPAPGVNPLPPPPAIPDHELLRVIGRGGYGEVWLARNVMGVLRAVKVIHRSRFDSVRPFEREFGGIQAYEPLSRTSDGLVQVLHVGRNDAQGCFYYVMELADDANDSTEVFARRLTSATEPATRDATNYVPRTLRLDLERMPRLPVAECAEIGRSLTAGLAQLHRHRLVHRDLKPSNVIFVNGRAKLADLGLVAGQDESRSFVGTEGFVPPEGPGRPTADLFGLGRLLYQAATGLTPERFPEIPPDWMDAPNAAELIEFHEVLLKLGEGDVRRRYQNANEVLADLALIQSGKSVRELRTLQRRLVWFRRLGLAALAGLVLAATAWSWAQHEARRERENYERLADAESRARRELINSYLAQARAERLAGGLGRREAVLHALTNALALNPDAVQRRAMRSTAAAALAQPGARWVAAPAALRNLDAMAVGGDSRQEIFARHDADGTLVITRLADGRELGRLPPLRPLDDEVTGFSPDNRFMLLRRGREFVVGDLRSGSYCRTNGACAFSPDSRLWVTDSGGLKLVTLPEGADVTSLKPPAGFTSDDTWKQVAVTMDGERLAATTGDDRIAVWSADGGSSESIHAPGPVYSLAWGPEPGQLAAGLEAGDVGVWQLPEVRPRWRLRFETAAIRRLAFDAGGRVLAVASEDESLKLLEAATGREIAALPAIAWQLSFRAADSRLALIWRGGEPGFVELIRPTAFRLLRGPHTSGGDGAMAFSPDGHWLALGTIASLDLWDVRADQLTTSIPTRGTRALAFSPKQEALRWLDGDEVCSVALEQGKPKAGSFRRGTGGGWTYLATGTRTDRTVLANSADDSLVVRTEGSAEVRLAPHQFVRFAAVRATGDLVASGSLTVRDVLLWNAQSGQQVARLNSGLNVRPVFSPDGHWLATVGPGCSLWSDHGWGPGPALPASPANTVAGAAAFSPDSRTLAAIYGDHEIHLFRLPEAAAGLVLEAPGGARLLSLAFSPDGTTLAATSVEGEVLLWNLPGLEAALAGLGLKE